MPFAGKWMELEIVIHVKQNKPSSGEQILFVFSYGEVSPNTCVYVCMCMYKIVGLSGEAKGRR
jgi:hypothetical protein